MNMSCREAAAHRRARKYLFSRRGHLLHKEFREKYPGKKPNSLSAEGVRLLREALAKEFHEEFASGELKQPSLTTIWKWRNEPSEPPPPLERKNRKPGRRHYRGRDWALPEGVGKQIADWAILPHAEYGIDPVDRRPYTRVNFINARLVEMGHRRISPSTIYRLARTYHPGFSATEAARQAKRVAHSTREGLVGRQEWRMVSNMTKAQKDYIVEAFLYLKSIEHTRLFLIAEETAFREGATESCVMPVALRSPDKLSKVIKDHSPLAWRLVQNQRSPEYREKQSAEQRSKGLRMAGGAYVWEYAHGAHVDKYLPKEDQAEVQRLWFETRNFLHIAFRFSIKPKALANFLGYFGRSWKDIREKMLASGKPQPSKERVDMLVRYFQIGGLLWRGIENLTGLNYMVAQRILRETLGEEQYDAIMAERIAKAARYDEFRGGEQSHDLREKRRLQRIKKIEESVANGLPVEDEEEIDLPY